jgi:hypothetical protein
MCHKLKLFITTAVGTKCLITLICSLHKDNTPWSRNLLEELTVLQMVRKRSVLLELGASLTCSYEAATGRLSLSLSFLLLPLWSIGDP